jgi:hypothetical protein
MSNIKDAKYVIYAEKNQMCTVFTYFSPRVPRILIFTSSFGGYRRRFTLYHSLKIIVIPMSSLEKVPAYNQASHRSGVHPEETEGEEELAACPQL